MIRFLLFSRPFVVDDVLQDGHVEKGWLLIDDAYGLSEMPPFKVLQTCAVEQNLSTSLSVESLQQLKDGRLATSRTAHDAHPFSGVNLKAHVSEDGLGLSFVFERHVVEADCAFDVSF